MPLERRHAVLAWLLLVLAAAPAAGQEGRGRLVVLGFDGLDHGTVARLLGDGQLPNLERLAAGGGLRPLLPSNPAISPVSWSALTTGVNPGRTGIDGFLRRDFSAGDVRIELSLVERRIDRGGLATRAARRWLLGVPFVLALLLAGVAWRRGWRGWRVGASLLAVALAGAVYVSETGFPDGRPRPVNLRHGQTYWERLDREGVETSTVLAPCSFPAPELDRGHVLCGLGVPDVQGTPGFWTVFRDDVAYEDTTETGGRMKPLVYQDPAAGDGPFETVWVDGPPDIVGGGDEPRRAPLVMTLSRRDGVVHVTDGLHNTQLVRGRWSDPFTLLFPLSSWMRVRGRSRFRLLSIDDSVRVYLDPISLVPGELPPGMRISHPDRWAYELEEDIGPYETLGWACATNPLKDGMISDRVFLEDANRVWDEQEKLAEHELAREGARVVTAIFTVPDRIQHMFMRYAWTDRDARGQLADPRYKKVIDDAYRRVDRFVGTVREKYLRPGDHLLVVSDHGFAPWRRSVNLSKLLVQEGLLVLRRDTARRKLHSGLASGRAFDEVDWSKTRAYSMGLGRIYLNRAGREPHGIVTDGEAPALLERIEGALRGLRDGEAPVVSSVARGEDIYEGDAIPFGAADLYVGFARGYRVSWQACLGGAHEPVVFDNVSAWSGDHCSVDPELVPGVLLSTLPLADGPARVVDVAPTVLDHLGVATSPGSPLDGRSLLER